MGNTCCETHTHTHTHTHTRTHTHTHTHTHTQTHTHARTFQRAWVESDDDLLTPDGDGDGGMTLFLSPPSLCHPEADASDAISRPALIDFVTATCVAFWVFESLKSL